MKAVSFKVSKPHSESIKVEKDILPYFYNKLHFHVDHQLTVINKSSGTLFIGDKITSFNKDDVYLIGQNLPHMFRNDPGHFENPKSTAEAVSLYFTSEFLGKDFFSIEESEDIRDLLENAGQGIKVKGEISEQCRNTLNGYSQLSGLSRHVALLDILNQIAGSGEYELLSSLGFTKPGRQSDDKKINDVFNFVMNHFQEEISLKLISEVASMSPTAFCRYFKTHTRKTFSIFLNEIRIGHACKLLLDADYSIAQVCYESGFNNLSNFNRHFKNFTGFTPRSYVKQHKS